MLKDLIKMAGRLDSMGLKREANIVDALIQKVAGDFDKPFDSAAYIAGRVEPSLPTSGGDFDSASYIAGRREPSRPARPDSYTERFMLTDMGFSPLSMDGLDPNIQSMLSSGEYNGNYNDNNGCYMVVPINYPKVGPMIYLRQPGKATRTYSGQNQDDLAVRIGYVMTPYNGYYRNGSLPVPGSEKLSG